MRDSLRVLIAVDGSESSDLVIDEAVRRPWSEQSRILILGVAEMPSTIMAGPLPMPGTYYQEWEKALADQAELNVTRVRDRFIAQGGRSESITTRVIKGNAKETIIDEAARFGAELVMIGTHGYNAMERMWLGSVSRTVSAHAGCSVEIVRRGTGPANGALRLLVAVDGSHFSDAAVAEVAERPWPMGSEVKIITAIHLPFIPTPETWALPDQYYAEAEQASREQAELILRRATATIAEGNISRSFPLNCTSEGILGHAEEVILSVAGEWEANLILLGSHGHGAFERFLLGSVSQAVAWHAPCSVEIVRPRPAALQS
ncbi:MAG: universal stress protein [Blastocatellia bacterium]